jgi:chromosome segregation ATPase
MAMEVDLALNARRFQAGTKDAERALEDLQDVIEDFTRDSTTAGEKAADGFGDAADAASDAEREIDDLGDAAKDAEREFEQAADAADELGDAAKRAGDSGRDGMDRAKEGAADFREEAQSTAREAAASFDGSADSIVDAFQEVTANAFAGFGPAGAAAGLAGAAGIGLATAALTAHDEAVELSKERIAEWAQAYIEAGSSRLSFAQIMARSEEILTDSDRLEEAETNARNWGVEMSTAVAAMSGDMAALEEVQASLTAQTEAYNEAVQNGTVQIDEWGRADQEWAQGIAEGTTALNSLTTEMEGGASAAGVMNEVLRNMALTTEGATSTVNEFGDSVYTLPDGAQILIDAETGQATTDLENVAYATNTLDGSNATVNVTANTAQAQATVNAFKSQPLYLQAQIRVRQGAANYE